MTTFTYKGLNQKPEIGNVSVEVLCNIWRLERVRNTRYDMTVSNEELLDAAKCQVYSFYTFCVIKGKPTGKDNNSHHPD